MAGLLNNTLHAGSPGMFDSEGGLMDQFGGAGTFDEAKHDVWGVSRSRSRAHTQSLITRQITPEVSLTPDQAHARSSGIVLQCCAALRSARDEPRCDGCPLAAVPSLCYGSHTDMPSPNLI
jgi:hypothetical protein